MPLCWKRWRPVFLLLVLYEVTVQGVTTPAPAAQTENSLPANGTANNSTHAVINQARTTNHIIPTMASHNTTITIESIMSQRDHLQAECDRLQVAVIILGIFFALAALFIIIAVIYVFLKRRKSGILRSDNRAQQTTSPEQKSAARHENLPKSQDKNNSVNQTAKNQTDKLVQQQEKEETNRHSTSTSRTSGDYEEQCNLPDMNLPKRPPVGPKTNKIYSNTKAIPGQSNSSEDLDEREVYIEVDEGKTTTNERDVSKPPIASGSGENIPSDEIYENYENYVPKAVETYSKLDPETQYDHHYD